MTSCLNLVMLNLHFNRLLNPSATTINQVCCFVKITQSFLLNPFCIRFVTIYLSVCNFAFMYSYKEIKFKPTNMTKTFHRAAMFFFFLLFQEDVMISDSISDTKAIFIDYFLSKNILTKKLYMFSLLNHTARNKPLFL